MDLGMLSAFWLVSFALVMTPGADWAYAISAGQRDRAIVPAVAGLLLGYVGITLVVAAGVGALVAGVPAILTALTYVGALYLLWLGVGVLRDPPVPSASDERAVGPWSGWLLRGFGIGGMNPKALLLFLALLPQFTSRDAPWPIPAQIGAMGLVQVMNCAVIYCLVALGSKAVLRARPAVARTVSRLSGGAMIAVALLLVAEQLTTVPRH